MAHRIWIETKQHPGTAGPGNMLGCCLLSFHFLFAILSTSTVLVDEQWCNVFPRYTVGTAVSMCVTLQRAAREVSGKCYQNIANVKLECSFGSWPLEQEKGRQKINQILSNFLNTEPQLFLDKNLR